MAGLVEKEYKKILSENDRDMKSFDQDDLAMHDRLKVDARKIDSMILSLKQLVQQEDLLGKERFPLFMTMASGYTTGLLPLELS